MALVWIIKLESSEQLSHVGGLLRPVNLSHMSLSLKPTSRICLVPRYHDNNEPSQNRTCERPVTRVSLNETSASSGTHGKASALNMETISSSDKKKQPIPTYKKVINPRNTGQE